MKLPVRILGALVLSVGWLAGVAHGQLTISYASNAASYLYAPLPGSSIAQGSFFVILGNGGQPSSATSNWSTYPLPTTLAGTSVTVTVGGSSANALIYYVGPSWSSSFTNQIDAVMPSGIPAGTGTVVVTQNGVSSAPFPVTVVASSPGGYAMNGAGSGPGVFYNVAANGSLTPNNLFHTAKPAQIVALHATGLGPAANPSAEGRQTPAKVDVRGTDFALDVYVGNQHAVVQYAGRSSYTAEDEIDFTVPSGVSGCYNEVAVYAGPPGNQTVSNFTSLSVDANGAVCSDADGINYKDLAPAIKSKGSANVGAISLLSNYQFLNVLGTTIQWDLDRVNGEVVTLTTQQLDASLGFTLAPSVNSCSVIQYLQFPPPTDPVLAGAFGPVVGLDAGAGLSIQGPNGSMPVPKNVNGVGYSAPVGGSTIPQLLSGGGLPPYFLNAQGWTTPSWTYAILPGGYTVTGPGGSNVSSFSASILVTSQAAAFNWTNSSITGSPIPRNQPLTITWSGGDPSGFVDITAIASATQQSLLPLPTDPGVQVECIAPASLGSFTIPAYVLQAMPSTVGTASPVAGVLQVGPASGAVSFSAVPAGLDAAYIFYHYIAGAPVTWQ